MATWTDVRRIALALPETVADDKRGNWWRVRGKPFAGERPLRRADLEHLGDAAPDGAILGFRVSDEGEKLALIEEAPDVFFTTPHFHGYPMVLAQLDRLSTDRLEEVLTEAWLVQAPKRLARDFLAARDGADA